MSHEKQHRDYQRTLVSAGTGLGWLVLFFFREKHCSDWKIKLNSVDYKVSRTGPLDVPNINNNKIAWRWQYKQFNSIHFRINPSHTRACSLGHICASYVSTNGHAYVARVWCVYDYDRWHHCKKKKTFEIVGCFTIFGTRVYKTSGMENQAWLHSTNLWVTGSSTIIPVSV